jgi:tRNA pseudouridine55 synthase
MNPYEEGQVMLINKPLGWTSADVVKKIRNRVHAKVGHAGTLDPLATGLLILCTGKFTKKINEYMLQEKEYTGTITLGATTASYDLETPPEDPKDFSHVDQAALMEVSKKFSGEIIQVPPVYSAIKKNGERSYDLARQGRAVALEGRKVLIKDFEMHIQKLPLISFRVVCSTGTYIRSLANDVGQALGCGAHLSSLCRTRIGKYLLENAVDPESAI